MSLRFEFILHRGSQDVQSHPAVALPAPHSAAASPAGIPEAPQSAAGADAPQSSILPVGGCTSCADQSTAGVVVAGTSAPH